MKTTFTGKGKMLWLLCLTGLLSFFATQVRADEGDPPTRVARISHAEGSVSLQPGGTGDWGNAAQNRPVTVGDKIWSDKDSRVELQAGQASIHMGSSTALSFLNLDQNITQMRLGEGSVNFRVRELHEGDLYEVDTPNLAFTVHQAGAFRIDVDENGDSTRVTVIRGEGEVTAGGKTYVIHGGERGEFNGTDEIQSNIDRAPGPDGLDRWAAERDLKEDNSTSAKYVSRDVSGYDDLDDYGDWRDVPEYGHVWYPRSVAVDWAPYSAGSWNWVGPWGWTWVDYEPWGFAPYHYGRWSYIGGGWGWCPGPIYASPIYGPAFVGFLGGGGWGAGFGFGGGWGGGVGWFPLGFGEPFSPWFHCSHNFITVVNVHNTFISNTNILNTTNIHNFNFANAHNVNAVTATSRNNFVNGQRVNRGEAHLTAASLRGAQVNTKFSASPTRASYFGGANSGNRVATPPTAVQNRAVVARTVPASAASHMPVRTINTSTLAPGRTTNSSANSAVGRPQNGASNSRGPASPNSGMTGRPSALQSQPPTSSSRQHELSLNRPPSAMPNASRTVVSSPADNASRGATNNPRTWSAQGNATDRGRAPQGAGRSNPSISTVQPARSNLSNRPPWAGTSRSNAGLNSGVSPRSGNVPQHNSRPVNADRGTAPNSNRSYTPPQRSVPSHDNNRNYSPAPRSDSQPSRSYVPPARTYSAPSRSYSAPSRSESAPSRSYSAPSRSESAPSRSYSAPSRSYSPPSRSYSAPSRSQSAPSRSYSAPSRSYSPPSRSYSAPSYSAPSRSSGGGGSPRGGGGPVNNGRH